MKYVNPRPTEGRVEPSPPGAFFAIAKNGGAPPPKKIQYCHGHSGREKNLKLSEFGILLNTYSLYISDFLYTSDLRLGQFRDLLIISQWGKNSNASNTNLSNMFKSFRNMLI